MPAFLRRAIKIGLIAGVVLIYLCLVGLVEAFDARNIVTGVLGLGRLMLFMVAIGAGYRAGVPMRDNRGAMARLSPGSAILAGIVSGAVAGALLGALLLVMQVVDLQGMLTSASGRLETVLSFGPDPVISALLLVVGAAFFGALGAALNLLPSYVRRPLVVAALTVLLISMLEPILRVMLVQLEAQVPALPFADLASFLY